MLPPLRYPGGKYRVAKTLLSYFPQNIHTYYEPFLGGGSVFLLTRKHFATINTFALSDSEPLLINFWQTLQENPTELIMCLHEHHTYANKNIEQAHIYYTCCKKTLLMDNHLSPITRAAMFFFVNKCSFSGTGLAGGFSSDAFLHRYTTNAINHLKQIAPLIQGSNIQFSHTDYTASITQSHAINRFFYFDPPYLSNKQSKLYGNQGSLHTSFNHHQLAELLKTMKTKWLLSYDDCPAIRQLYSFAHIHPHLVQYGMTNVMKNKIPKKPELIITNY